MYSYYLLASLGVPCPWKRHLTLAQMVQFAACAAQSLYILATPGVCPTALPLTQLWVMSNMLFLFGRFYVVRHSRPRALWSGSSATRALELPAMRWPHHAASDAPARRHAPSQAKYSAAGGKRATGAVSGAQAAPPGVAPCHARVRRID